MVVSLRTVADGSVIFVVDINSVVDSSVGITAIANSSVCEGAVVTSSIYVVSFDEEIFFATVATPAAEPPITAVAAKPATTTFCATDKAAIFAAKPVPVVAAVVVAVAPAVTVAPAEDDNAETDELTPSSTVADAVLAAKADAVVSQVLESAHISKPPSAAP